MNICKLFLSCALLFIFMTGAVMAGPAIDADGFITHWLLLGHIPWADIESRLLVDQLKVTKQSKDGDREPLIKKIEPKEGAKGTGLAAALSWTLQDDPDKNIDLDAIYGAGKNEQVVAYGFTSVTSPKDQDVQLRVGSDDGIMVWLNHVMVLNQGHYRGGADDQDIVAVKLGKGPNSVLVKVVEQGGGWNFRVRFTDSGGKPIPDLKIATAYEGAAQAGDPLDLDPKSKLTTTWGSIKSLRK
jgi:hypothetical protein